MDALRSDPRSVSISTKLYQALLGVYPTGFRQEYGSQMAQVFTDRARDQHQKLGASGLLAWWGRTMFDTLQTAVEQHSQRGVDMSKQSFIKISGWSMALGSLVLFMGLLASLRPEYITYNMSSYAVDRYLNVLDTPLIIIGILMISLGLLGYLSRFSQVVGGAGRAFLVLGALCGVLSSAGAVGLAIVDHEPWWSVFIIGYTAQSLFVALFGAICLKRGLLDRWSSLPLLAGMWIPVWVIVSSGIEIVGGGWTTVYETLTFIVFIINSASMALAGYTLQADVRVSQPEVTPA